MVIFGLLTFINLSTDNSCLVLGGKFIQPTVWWTITWGVLNQLQWWDGCEIDSGLQQFKQRYLRTHYQSTYYQLAQTHIIAQPTKQQQDMQPATAPADLHYLPLQTTMPLMNPQYPPEYYDKFTLLKKHIQLQLYTPDANLLAEQLIPYGQTNYNCWYVKKMCYLAGVITCQHELQFTEQTLYDKIKNFQLWQHRRFIIERNPQHLLPEYALIDRVLEIEPKNYHAWSHRIWVVDQVYNHMEQLQMTSTLLNEDPYNNSVWSYRSYLIKSIVLNETVPENKEKIVVLEITECLAWLARHLDNQAVWNHLRGYFPSIKLKTLPCTNNHTPLSPVPASALESVTQFVKHHLQKVQSNLNQDKSPNNQFNLQTQVQLLTTLACLHSQHEDTLEYARNTCTVLAEKDFQKRFYWKWVAANV